MDNPSITQTLSDATEMNGVQSTHSISTMEYPPFPAMIRYTLAVCLAVVCLVGLVGNSLVMLSVIFSRKLQTNTNIFVFTLAVADFMTCCGMPFSVISLVHDALPYPHPLCTLGACLIWVGVGSSVLNLGYISFNRFILITRSRTSYENIFNKFVVTGMLLFAWTFPFLLYIIPVFVKLDGIGYTARFHVCMTDAFAYLGVFCQFPASVVIVFCYIKVYCYIRSHAAGLKCHSMKERPEASSLSVVSSVDYKRRTSTVSLMTSAKSPVIAKDRRKTSVANSISSREVQVTKNMFFVVCGYYICIMPYMVVTIFTDLMDPDIWAITLPLTTSFMLLNSCLNFVIYSLNHPQFNAVFRKIVTCRWSKIPQPSTTLQRILSIRNK